MNCVKLNFYYPWKTFEYSSLMRSKNRFVARKFFNEPDWDSGEKQNGKPDRLRNLRPKFGEATEGS
jgi:hypothetical protein